MSELRRVTWFARIAIVLLPVLPIWAAEEEVGGGEEGVEVPDFLEDKDEGHLAVTPDSVKPEAYALYKRALFFLKNAEKRRTFWGVTLETDGHSHEAALDGVGNGVTDVVDGHYHEVKGGILHEAMASTGSLTVAAHTHEMKRTDYEKAGNLEKPYFFHVLGLTTELTKPDGTLLTHVESPHRHIVACYYRGARQSVTTKNAGHRHLVKNFKIGKAVNLRGRRATLFNDAHGHKVKWIAKQYFSADSFEFLADLFEQAARKNKDFPQAYYYECICQQTIHEYDLALKNVNKAIQSIDGFHEAYVERGDINMWLGNTGKSHTDYRKASKIDPSYSHAHVMDGMAFLKEGSFPDAEESFVVAIDKGRKEAEAKIAALKEKATIHLDAKKQGALNAFIEVLLEGDRKKLARASRDVNEEFEGVERAWVNKAQSICGEYLQASYWAKELEKEKPFPGWKPETKITAETDHYMVYSQMNQALNDYIGGQLESAYKLYRMKFKLQIPQKIQIRVFLYPDMKAYYRDGAPVGSGGYSNPYFKKLVWPINPKDYQKNGFSLDRTPDADNLKDTLLVLFHEAFHQYLNKFLSVAPQVFNEGCADYFGPSKFNIRRVGKGWTGDLIVRVNRWRLATIRQMIRQEIHLPLEPFWKETKGEMYNRNYAGMNYAHAWAWVFFLFEKIPGKSWKEMPEAQKRGPRKHFDLLGKYYQALRKGKGLNRAWDASFGKLRGRKLADLEEEWQEFILKLK